MTKTKIKLKEAKVKQVKKGKRSKAAYVLVLIAVIFLLVNGLLVILARNWVVSLMQQYGIITTAGSWVTYGVIWLVLAFLLWLTMLKIESTGLKSEKWLLLALSIITAFSGRLEAGILSLIAAIIYLRQK